MPVYAKIQITGTIEVKTGLHIGGSSAFSAIGAVDSPVIRDPKTKDPIIPGSSIKGKMRTLLAKSECDGVNLKDCNEDGIKILRIFGGSKKSSENGNRIPQSRLKFSDCFMINSEELKKREISATEIKFENSINRKTAEANPRQIERVIRGALFGLNIIYDVENADEVLEDFQTLRRGMKLIEYDYLGGHGSRGSGRISFSEIKADIVYGGLDGDVLNECRKALGAFV